MSTVFSRASHFLRGVSKDTHIWGVGIMLGAILLSISFFLEPDDREFIMQSQTVKAAEQATVFAIPDCFNVGSVILPDIESVDENNNESESSELDGYLSPADKEAIVDEAIAENLGNEKVEDEEDNCEDISDMSEIDIDSVSDKELVDAYLAGEKISGALDDVSEIDSDEIKDDKEECDNLFISMDEYEALCKIVATEANTEDMIGKILVADVIINRVDDAEFPNNIVDVITERGQFSPVTRGSYENAFMDNDSKEAVIRALSGEDYSEGALFFQKSKSKFWGEKEFLFRHGHHSFYK